MRGSGEGVSSSGGGVSIGTWVGNHHYGGTHNKETTSTSTSQSQPVSAPTQPPSHAPHGRGTVPKKPSHSAGDGFNLDSLLYFGEVLLVCDDFHSLEIPAQIRTSFWKEKETVLPPDMLKQLEMDLDWPSIT